LEHSPLARFFTTARRLHRQGERGAPTGYQVASELTGILPQLSRIDSGATQKREARDMLQHLLGRARTPGEMSPVDVTRYRALQSLERRGDQRRLERDIEAAEKIRGRPGTDDLMLMSQLDRMRLQGARARRQMENATGGLLSTDPFARLHGQLGRLIEQQLGLRY
jgi:hypothetical protein